MTLIAFPKGGTRVPEFDLADRMRKSARVARLNNKQIAAALDVTPETVSAWINGRHEPSSLVLTVWAQMTDVDLEWLRNGVGGSTSGPDGGFVTKQYRRLHVLDVRGAAA